MINKPKTLSQKINLWNDWAKKTYGKKTYKIPLALNTICPNRKSGACVFCLQSSFSYSCSSKPINKQISEYFNKTPKNPNNFAYLAYFQDETTGAVDIEVLENAFKTVLQNPKIKGIICSTRPDYFSKNFAALVKKYNATVEIGLQTIHNKSLKLLNRNHTFEDFEKAYSLAEEFNIKLGVHLIIGIPDESFENMLKTINYVNSKPNITEVKLHNLVVYKGTKLATMPYKVINIEQYIDILAKILSLIDKSKIISRLFTSNFRMQEISVNTTGTKKLWLNALLKKLYE